MRYYSHHLGRDIEVLVFGEAGFPVILFPDAMGRYFQHKDNHMIDSVASAVDAGVVRIYCMDCIDGVSWFNKDAPPAERIRHHMHYDSMLNDELVPTFMEETGCDRVVVAGCGFGGYHASNFAFKHPEKVSHLFSMSGSFDAREQLEGFYNDDAYYNSPVDFVPGSNHPDLWQMKIILGTTDQDPQKGANENMSLILSSKGIEHWLDVRHGPRDWTVWRQMFPHYLSLI